MIHAQKSITLVTQVEYGGHLVCMSGARANPLPTWLCTEDQTKRPRRCSRRRYNSQGQINTLEVSLQPTPIRRYSRLMALIRDSSRIQME
jgi:hypothetical protein